MKRDAVRYVHRYELLLSVLFVDDMPVAWGGRSTRAYICVRIYITARFPLLRVVAMIEVGRAWFSIVWIPPNIPCNRSPSFRCPRLVDGWRSSVFLPTRSSPRCRAERIYCRTNNALVPTAGRRLTASPIHNDPSCSNARHRSKCPSHGRQVCASRAMRLFRAWNRDKRRETLRRSREFISCRYHP